MMPPKEGIHELRIERAVDAPPDQHSKPEPRRGGRPGVGNPINPLQDPLAALPGIRIPVPAFP